MQQRVFVLRDFAYLRTLISVARRPALQAILQHHTQHGSCKGVESSIRSLQSVTIVTRSPYAVGLGIFEPCLRISSRFELYSE